MLLARAQHDPRITAAAHTGSAARDAEDRWSDIDLYFGVTDLGALEPALADWTSFLYSELGAVHHFDLHDGPAIYRAFLLDDLLEVDLGFTPAATFGPRGPGAFQMVFGDPLPRRQEPADLRRLIGFAWHHVLHAHLCIRRGAAWQAEHWISGLRESTLGLACARLGHEGTFARGADRLPDEVTAPIRAALVRSLDPDELLRALAAGTRAFLGELHLVDSRLTQSLEGSLTDLVGTAAAPRRGTESTPV